MRGTPLTLGPRRRTRAAPQTPRSAGRSAASASRASLLSEALWPELQTPVESRSMVLTLRVATGLET